MPASDIIGPSLWLNLQSGRHVMDLTFGPATAQWLARATAAHVGAELGIAVCGTVINAPYIQAPITSGTLAITGEVERSAAEVELVRILGDAQCP